MATINPNSAGSGFGNPYVDSLVWGGSWTPMLGTGVVLEWAPADGKRTLNGTDVRGGNVNDKALQELREAYQAFSAVADLTFEEKGLNAANVDLNFLLVNERFADKKFGTDFATGYSEVPDGSAARPLSTIAIKETGRAIPVGKDNKANWVWTAATDPGSFTFSNYLHEIGHSLGLAHPHDGGSKPTATKFAGVTGAFQVGTNKLNQGIWTVMSYVQGWKTGNPDLNTVEYGLSATPMAFDIAALQRIYGVNGTAKAGDDVYRLPIDNKAGTGWSCLWDTAGTDEITARTAKAGVVIDLRAAPLNEVAAKAIGLTADDLAGAPSFVTGIFGGVTIANGVQIENADGSDFADRLIGNSADNVLRGQKGDDMLEGRAGADKLIGGEGADTFRFSTAPIANVVDRIEDFVTGTDRIELARAAFPFIGPKPGALPVDRFVLGKKAEDKDDRIIYDKEKGLLIYDADGKGPIVAVIFAKLPDGTDLAAADLFII